MSLKAGDALRLEKAEGFCAAGDFHSAWKICLEILVLHAGDEAAWVFADNLAGNAAKPELAIGFAKQLVADIAESPWPSHILARVHISAQQYDEAVASCDRALAINPDFAQAHSRRGTALLKLRRFSAALPSFTRAVALKPELAEAWAGLGRTFGKLGDYKLAIGAFRRALAIKPDLPFLKGRLLQQMLLSCDWKDLVPLIEEMAQDVLAGRKSARPFVWQAVSSSPRSLQKCAELFNVANAGKTAPRISKPETSASGKIRIGYVSGEYRQHSTSYLRVGVFENHDQGKFEIVAFDNGWDDGGETRARINQAIDRIIDINSLNDAEAAALIERENIDILVDLNGFNGRNSMGVFALRPAPVQVSFPGYPGTLGGDCHDYIIADATIIPSEHMQYYAEQVVHMPGSYQANDNRRAISERQFTKAELGLPEDGAIFCCFNNNYKILPAMLDSWIRILNAVPGSILWLLSDNPAAVVNLRKEALARGLDPERLIFAERLEVSEHLARHRVADLFLDTLPCGAHATASDALWSGLPVLTCLGGTFSGRVGASLLRAVEMPELVCETIEDYERKAVQLATDPAELARLKQRLADKRLTTPLFDSRQYTRHLENAYREMYNRSRSGKQPSPIVVPDL